MYKEQQREAQRDYFITVMRKRGLHIELIFLYSDEFV